jgi:hypothetical protein
VPSPRTPPCHSSVVEVKEILLLLKKTRSD